MTKEYILSCIEKYCNLEEAEGGLAEGTFYDIIVRPLKHNNCFEGYWNYEVGATKGVLIFDKCDFVIKIPLWGEWYEEEGYYDEDGDYIVTAEEGIAGCSFNGNQVEGFIKEREWDYCETESLRFLKAKEYGLEECFAETIYAKKIKNYPIYIQPKACMFDEYVSSTKKERTEKEYEEVRSVQSAVRFYLPEEWAMDFIHYFGEQMYACLADFCEDYFVTDLHRGNLGYICGVPCLVDYASYEQ